MNDIIFENTVYKMQIHRNTQPLNLISSTLLKLVFI